MRRAKQIGCFFILLAAVLIINCCSPLTGKSLLTFFFDGVPGTESTDSENENIPDQSVDTVTSSAISRAANRTAMLVHYPYQEKECGACHNQNSLGEMVEQEPGLCYLCHEDFGTLFKTIHGPVAGGYCTACHNPHMAENEHLLRFTGQELCFYCHRSTAVLKNEIHMDLDGMNCTDCHNPHGGEDRYILY